MAPNDPPAPEEAPLHIEEVHRAAQASRAAGILAEELCHRALGGHPASERNAVIAISLEDVVAIFEDFGSGNRNGFLSDV